jgi:hypothetical protein
MVQRAMEALTQSAKPELLFLHYKDLNYYKKNYEFSIYEKLTNFIVFWLDKHTLAYYRVRTLESEMFYCAGTVFTTLHFLNNLRIGPKS